MAIDISDTELRQFMRDVMTRKGLNINSWSKLARKSEGTLRQFFDDPTRSMKVSTLQDYLEAAGLSLADARKQYGFKEEGGRFSSHRNKQAPEAGRVTVVGHIGVNGRFFPHEGRGKPEEINIPVAGNVPASEILALRVKGDDMLPVMRDGWTIYYHAANNVKGCLGQLCFVQVSKGGSYIRELREGRKKGSYMLISHNGTLMEDVKIDWAYPIISIEPR